MATQGPNYPSGASDGGGSYAWSSPSNILTSNDVRASVSVPGPGYIESNKLYITGFGFSIPSGATIDGILAEWEVYADSTGPGGTYPIGLTKNGTTIAADSGASKSIASGPPDIAQSQGGATDKWTGGGYSGVWTDSEINASTFGLVLGIYGTAAVTVSFDFARLTIYYTAAAAGQPAMRRMGGVPGILGAGRLGRSW